MKASRGIISAILAAAVGAAPLGAGERRGATVVVSMKDGTAASGELLAVKPDAVAVMVNETSSPADRSIRVKEIRKIRAVRKSKAAQARLLGGLIGATAGAISGDYKYTVRGLGGSRKKG